MSNQLSVLETKEILPQTIIGSGQIGIALESLQKVLDTGVCLAKAMEDGKTQRALIQAQKEIQIIAIEEKTKREIDQDLHLHTQRMQIIDIINHLLVDNARNLTPEILDACRLMKEVLSNEK